MAYMGHGSADIESLSEVMDSQGQPTSEFLAIFMDEPTSAESGGDSILDCLLESRNRYIVLEIRQSSYIDDVKLGYQITMYRCRK